jgi:hypothetical protein
LEYRKKNEKNKDGSPYGHPFPNELNPANHWIFINYYKRVTFLMRFWLTKFVGQTPRKSLVIHADQGNYQGLQLGYHEALKSAL